MNYRKAAVPWTGAYTEEEAEQWIAEYKKATSGILGGR